MAIAMDCVLRHVRRVAVTSEAATLGDGQLLERYLSRRDEAAFEALVHRHGGMVLGVCRRILKNPHDADDAFQATFLVLVRKAACIRPSSMVGNWLYGVACRTASKARASRGKRQSKERAAPLSLPSAERSPCDIDEVIDREVARLPDKYRAPLLLCDLEGRTRREAAQRLGWPEGTVATRLAHGRRLLARRLARHGLPVAAGVLALPLSAAAALPAPLVTGTLRFAARAISGQTASIPAHLLALSQGVIKSMFLTKLKLVTVLALLAGVIGLGISAGADDAPAAQHAAQQPPSVEQKPTPRTPLQRAGDREPDELLPSFSAPVPALVSLDDEGALTVRMRQMVHEPWTSVLPDGRRVTSYRLVDRLCTGHYNLAKTSVYDTSGKLVEPRELRKVLKKGELLALVAEAGHPGVYLKLIKEGTLIFVLPTPPPTTPSMQAAPSVVVPPPLRQVSPPAPAVIAPAAEPVRQASPPPTVERIGQVIIIGNKQTPDDKIRKHAGLLPGAVVTGADLRVAQGKLAELALFERVAVTLCEAEEGFSDVIIAVVEKPAEGKLEKKATAVSDAERERFQGVWTVVSVSLEGLPISKEKIGELVFKDDCVVIKGTGPAGSASFQLGAKPRTIRFFSSSPAEKFPPATGVYEFDGDVLRLSLQANYAQGEQRHLVMILRRAR